MRTLVIFMLKKLFICKICLFILIFSFNLEALANNFQYYSSNALKYFNSGNFVKAAECFEQMKKWIPSDPNIYYNTALAYKNSNKIDKSIENINKAISLDSKNTQYYLFLYHLYEQNCLFDKAYQVIEKAHIINPNDENVRSNLAIASAILARDFYSIQKFNEAEVYFKKSLSFKTKDDVLHEIAQTFLKADQYEYANIVYGKILQNTPDDRYALTNKEYAMHFLNEKRSHQAINQKISNTSPNIGIPEKLHKLIIFKNTFSPDTQEKTYKMIGLVWNDEQGRILLERIMKKKIKITVSSSPVKSYVYNSKQQYTYYLYGFIPIKFSLNEKIDIFIEEKSVQLFYENNVYSTERIHALSTLIHEIGHAVKATMTGKIDNSIEEEMGVSMIGYNIANRIINDKDLTSEEIVGKSKDVLLSLLKDEHKYLPLYNNFYGNMEKIDSVIPSNSYIYRDLPSVYELMKKDANVRETHPELEKAMVQRKR
ncbi:MAG: hypothetical protein A2Y25_09455 [Candidatus Melainabacteria bacterium GWF2_37_15]|nr:MAG: hypothetical protein A2Y25_09455 [Candidatus Melainabacteria bacterium GWF2_37_15]